MFDKLVADVKYMNGEYEAAAEMYREGAREGELIAAFDYGYCLWRGIGVPRDAKEAKSYFVFARDLEGGEACYNLAVMYMQGDGVPKSYKLAVDYMKSAAALGCVEAQLYLGVAHTLGAVFEPDVIGICMIPYHKAEYLSVDTLISGDTTVDFEEDARLRYAAIVQNEHAAFEYFKKSARADATYSPELVAKGKFLYAKCYADGLGTDIDIRKSARLMLMAKNSGSAEAGAYLAEIGAQLLAEKRRVKSE